MASYSPHQREIRDSQGNLLISTERRVEDDAWHFRLTAQMMHQLRMGDGIMIRVGYDGQPVMTPVRGYGGY
jgi:hypothetical protein